jgi:hypothetical protein
VIVLEISVQKMNIVMIICAIPKQKQVTYLKLLLYACNFILVFLVITDCSTDGVTQIATECTCGSKGTCAVGKYCFDDTCSDIKKGKACINTK